MTSIERGVGGDHGPSAEGREEGAVVVGCDERGEKTGERVGWIGGFSFGGGTILAGFIPWFLRCILDGRG
jgi:hypothetical protein